MKWHLESWRKLYRTCPPSWLRLSVSARGLGSELLKYADDEGLIDTGDDDPGVAIAFMLGARPREHKRIREDVAELLKDGYLQVSGQSLKIRNFVEAQDRTPGARRTAEWRARKSSPETSPRASPETSHVTSPETSHVQDSETSIRHDPTRSDPTRRSLSDPSPPLSPPEAPRTRAAAAGPVSNPVVAAILDALTASRRLGRLATRPFAERSAMHSREGGFTGSRSLEDILRSLAEADEKALDREAAGEPVDQLGMWVLGFVKRGPSKNSSDEEPVEIRRPNVQMPPKGAIGGV